MTEPANKAASKPIPAAVNSDRSAGYDAVRNPSSRCRFCFGTIFLCRDGWHHDRDAAATCLPETERRRELVLAVPND